MEVLSAELMSFMIIHTIEMSVFYVIYDFM